MLDLLTGDELWRRSGISPASLLVVTDDAVCVTEHQENRLTAYRLVDGRELPSDSISDIVERAFAVQGGTLLTRQSQWSLFKPRVRIAAERPLAPQPDWSVSIPSETVLQRLSPRELAGVEPTGDVFVLDLETGERQSLGRLPAVQAGIRPTYHFLADRDRVFVIVRRDLAFDLSNVSLPSIEVNGDLVAFSRRDRRLLWQTAVKEGSLVTTEFADSPVVVVVQHGVPDRRPGFLEEFHLPELSIVAIDKNTGKRVIDWKGTTSTARRMAWSSIPCSSGLTS